MNNAPMPTPAAYSAAPSPASPPARHRRRQWRLLVFTVIWSTFSYIFITRFLVMAVEIKGVSMSPTLLDGERYLLYRCTYLLRPPRKGEIVVIRDPEDHGLSIKRIVALPNEVVEFRADGLYVDKVKVSEPYLMSKYNLEPHYRPTLPIQLAANQYFVLGDNRGRSADSRLYGPVPRDQILGVIDK